MFLLYRYGKCCQSFVVLLFMLFCGAYCWAGAGIDIINEGRAFTSDGFTKPWELLYSLSGSVICKDIKDKYNEDSITYYNEPNVVISKVLMVRVENIIKNTTLFSIDTNKPVFFVYLESAGASSSWEPMSPLMVFKNNSAKGDEINIEIRDSNKELSVLRVPWVTVKTRGGNFVYDRVKDLGTMSYCRKGEVRSSEVIEGNRGRRGEVCGRFDDVCGHCRGIELVDVELSVCSCGTMYQVETELYFSFRVLYSTDDTGSVASKHWHWGD